jgi:hypothetical protein
MMLAAVNVNTNYSRLQRVLGFEDGGIPYSRVQLLKRIHSDLHITFEQGTLRQLMTFMDAGIAPAIFVSTGELPYWSTSVYHAVVLVGYTETEFYINDPAFANAPQVASKGDLDLAWLEYDSYFAVIQRQS